MSEFNLTYIQIGTNHVYKVKRLNSSVYKMLDESSGAVTSITRHQLEKNFRYSKKLSKPIRFGTIKKSKHDHLFIPSER